MATFGNIITGASSVNAPPSGDKAVSKFTLDRQGVIDHLLFLYNGSQVAAAKAVIYDDTGSGGLPGALLATSSSVSGGSSAVAFPFSAVTLNPGNYWAGLISATQSNSSCAALTNGIAFNANSGSPSNPFGASPSMANFRYPLVVYYTPVLSAGTAYGNLLGGDAISGHSYLANEIIVFQISIPVAGSISKLTTFIQNSFPSAKCKGVIYDSTGPSGGPGNLLGTTNELVGPVINGNDLIFASPVNVSAGLYYMGVHTDTNMAVYHNVDATPNAVGARTYTSGVPSAFPGSPTLSAGSWALWATFTAAAAKPSSRGVIIF